jgi:hypothetical protein
VLLGLVVVDEVVLRRGNVGEFATFALDSSPRSKMKMGLPGTQSEICRKIPPSGSSGRDYGGDPYQGRGAGD